MPAVVDSSSPNGSAPKLKPFAPPQPHHAILKPTFTKQPSMPQHVGFADSPLFGHLPYPMTPKLLPHPSEATAIPPKFSNNAALPPPSAYPYGSHYAPPFTPLHTPYAPQKPLQPLYSHPKPQPLFDGYQSGPPVPPVPPELANLPWGAQMYVKQIRAMQEEEERERARAAAAAAGGGGAAGTSAGAKGELASYSVSRSR